jgi:hypothetical protein
MIFAVMYLVLGRPTVSSLSMYSPEEELMELESLGQT